MRRLFVLVLVAVFVGADDMSGNGFAPMGKYRVVPRFKTTSISPTTVAQPSSLEVTTLCTQAVGDCPATAVSNGGICANSGDQSTCALSCAAGYCRSTDATFLCTCNAWSCSSGCSPILPTCSAATCPAVTSLPANAVAGTCVAGGTTNNNCQLGCANGYAVAAYTQGVCTGKSECLSSWTGQNITCTPVNCAALTPPSNGGAGTCTSQVLGSTCTAVCNSGYVPSGSASGTCTAGTGATASWTGVTLTCAAANCPALTPTSPQQAGSCLSAVLTSTCYMACDNGYTSMAGMGSCSANGVGAAIWTGASVVCTPVPCSGITPTAPTAAGTCGNSGNLGEKCSLSCTTGYIVGTVTQGSCVGTGVGTSAWSGQAVVCTAATCNAPIVSVPQTIGTCTTNGAQGNTCSPACSAGYVISSASTATCQPCGVGCAAWNPVSVTCTLATCPALAPTNPQLVGNCTIGGVQGTICYLACANGYSVSGSTKGVCTPGTGQTASWLNAAITCTPVNCAPVTSLTTGQLQNNCSSKVLGSTCQLACDNGYVPSNIVQGTCMAGTGPTASWSGMSIICSAAYCSAAAAVLPATVGSCLTQQLFSTCSLDCQGGYSATSSTVGRCVAGVGPTAVWSGQSITCTPGGCASWSTIPANATVGNCTAQTLNTRCVLGCQNGYARTAFVAGVCDGTSWTPSPTVTCVAATCAAATAPNFGTVGTCTGNAAQGSTCSFQCLNGYVPSSNSPGSCSADAGPTASWKNQGLVCSAALCAAVSGLTTGQLAGTCLTAALNANCNLQCDNGYVPSNSVAGKCTAQVGPTAVWTNHSITCTPANCAPVTPPTNALVGSCSTQPLFATCNLQCKNGYVPTGAVSGTCQAGSGPTASWINQVISCNPAFCSSFAPLPGNALVGTCTSQSLGSTCTLSCLDGYTGSGSLGTCVNGTGAVALWSGVSISCVAANCPTVSSLPSNAVPGSCTSKVLGSTCTLGCSDGYLVGSSVSGTCTATGPGVAAWANQQITCTPVSCMTPGSLPAHATAGTCLTAGLLSTCQLGCDDGYAVASASAGTCTPGTGAAAAWAGMSITCNPVNCSAATPPANALANSCTNKMLGSSCQYACIQGYSASDVAQGTCTPDTGATAQWQGAAITCTPMGTVCFPYSSLPENANPGTCYTSPVGTQCQLGCQAGYVSSDVAIGVCNASVPTAQWLGLSITCEPAKCTPVTLLPGHALAGSCVEADLGSRCNLSCADGYVGSGILEGTCQPASGASAMWTGQFIACFPASCAAVGTDVLPAYGTLGTCSISTVDATCALGCLPGCTPSGSGTLTCRAGVGATASWSTDSTLVCTPSSCATLTALPLNARPGNCTTGQLGAQCQLACANGYEMTNPVAGVCTGSGTSASWVGADGVCVPLKCAPLASFPANAAVGSCGEAALGSSCQLACANGFSASSSSPGTCTAGVAAEVSWQGQSIQCDAANNAALVGGNGAADSSNVGMGSMIIPIAGGVVGLCLIVTVILIVVIVRRRKSKPAQDNDGTIRIANDKNFDGTIMADRTNYLGADRTSVLGSNSLNPIFGGPMESMTSDISFQSLEGKSRGDFNLDTFGTVSNPAFSIQLEDSMQMKKWDEFTVLKELGAGAFGVVYHVREKSTFTDMALKVFKNVRTPDEVASFCREANVLLNLHHQHCLACFGLMQHDNELGLLMEFMSGGDLKSAMGKLNKAKKLTVLSDACKGLAYLHTRNLVHGDIKPGNILLDGYGVAKLADFGVTGASGLGFTERYAAPEVLRGDSKPSASSDVYSYGLTIVEVFSGKQPFEKLKSRAGNMDAAPYDKLDAVPASIRPVIERCLSTDPALRPPAAEIIEALTMAK